MINHRKWTSGCLNRNRLLPTRQLDAFLIIQSCCTTSSLAWHAPLNYTVQSMFHVHSTSSAASRRCTTIQSCSNGRDAGYWNPDYRSDHAVSGRTDRSRTLDGSRSASWVAERNARRKAFTIISARRRSAAAAPTAVLPSFCVDVPNSIILHDAIWIQHSLTEQTLTLYLTSLLPWTV